MRTLRWLLLGLFLVVVIVSCGVYIICIKKDVQKSRKGNPHHLPLGALIHYISWWWEVVLETDHYKSTKSEMAKDLVSIFKSNLIHFDGSYCQKWPTTIVHFCSEGSVSAVPFSFFAVAWFFWASQWSLDLFC